MSDHTTETLRILVVDDELGMRLGVTRVLRDFSVRLPEVESEVRFSVDQAGTGEEALEKIADTPPDMLLLDYKLPGISGLDVLEQLSDQPVGDMLTIVITAYASIETAVIATKRGAYDFLAKPFTPDELKNTVRKAAGRLMLAKQARKLAAEKQQVRFQFISVLAHELKSPINAVEGYLRIMKDRTLGDDPAAYDSMVERSVIRIGHMRKLIDDLLDLTRIESGQKKRELTEVDVREVAQVAMDGVMPDAMDRHITLDLHADEPVTMWADPGEIEIILNNLISNAVKYNRDGGRVDVTLGVEAGKVTIIVADTGIGMTNEEAERLFNDFVRIRNEKTHHIAGSGLGLSIVKKLALLYDGEVQVHSEPDVGSRFTVVLNPTQTD